jgi:heme/copper-type cytochrome/quinol oxidase subunit 4
MVIDAGGVRQSHWKRNIIGGWRMTITMTIISVDVVVNTFLCWRIDTITIYTTDGL